MFASTVALCGFTEPNSSRQAFSQKGDVYAKARKKKNKREGERRDRDKIGTPRTGLNKNIRGVTNEARAVLQGKQDFYTS